MTAPPKTVDGKQVWRCDGCLDESTWTNGHAVYGSLRDEDDSRWENLTVTCSPECRGLGLMPRDDAATFRALL